MDDNRALDGLVAKLDRLGSLQEADRGAVRDLFFRIKHTPANKLIVREGDPTEQCGVLVEGYACRHKMTASGNRQIVSFHMPGDVLDLQHLLLSRADHNVQTMTTATIAWISVPELRAIVQERPALSEALWRDTLVDASIFREWVLNVGRREAKARIAHLLCEFAARRELSGLGPLERFELPMTQEQIGDATGLTSVHVNRKLGEIEASGVIVRNKRMIEITNWPRLCRIAEFDTTYLHAVA